MGCGAALGNVSLHSRMLLRLAKHEFVFSVPNQLYIKLYYKIGRRGQKLANGIMPRLVNLFGTCSFVQLI